MGTFLVQLSSIQDVKEFVKETAEFPCEIDARVGHYLVNGKSILGLLGIDLASPISVEVHGNEKQTAELKANLAAFVVEENTEK